MSFPHLKVTDIDRPVGSGIQADWQIAAQWAAPTAAQSAQSPQKSRQR